MDMLTSVAAVQHLEVRYWAFSQYHDIHEKYGNTDFI